MLSTNKIHQHTAQECGDEKFMCENRFESSRRLASEIKRGDVKKMSMIQSGHENVWTCAVRS